MDIPVHSGPARELWFSRASSGGRNAPTRTHGTDRNVCSTKAGAKAPTGLFRALKQPRRVEPPTEIFDTESRHGVEPARRGERDDDSADILAPCNAPGAQQIHSLLGRVEVGGREPPHRPAGGVGVQRR